jgi:methionyl-tRNA formyltransferase
LSHFGFDLVCIVNSFGRVNRIVLLHRGQILKINKARLSNESAPISALRSKEKSIFVGTSTSALELLEVTPAGKAQMLATSWANGARLSANDLLQ